MCRHGAHSKLSIEGFHGSVQCWRALKILKRRTSGVRSRLAPLDAASVLSAMKIQDISTKGFSHFCLVVYLFLTLFFLTINLLTNALLEVPLL